MLSSQENVLFFHFPRLSVSGEGVEILGGKLAPFAFEEFEQLDSDWARRSYFERTAPVVWRRTHTESRVHNKFDMALKALREAAATEAALLEFLASMQREKEPLPFQDLSLLIYDALLAVTAGDYPDPRLSIRYHWRQGSTHREYGPFHRTFLLNQDVTLPLDHAALERIRALAEQWAAAGFNHNHAVFAPLRSLSIMAANQVSPEVAVVPLVVSLEGYLLAEEVSGIAKTLTRRAEKLLGPWAPVNLKETLNTAYAWRSDVLHGRPAKLTTYPSIGNELRRLTANLVIAMANTLIQAGCGGDDLDVVRATLKV